MLCTQIHIGKEPYPLYMGKDLIVKLDSLLSSYIKNRFVCMLTDENVFNHYGKTIIDVLKNNGAKFDHFIIPSGEESKSIDNYRKIIDKLTDEKYNRNSVLIAVGGGVIGDLGGFVASTYMRGRDMIHIPTTLLAQVDSSIGGKTGINYEGFKNLLGTFYHPKAVVVDTNTLNTLPNREFIAAFGEVIKYGILGDYNLLVDLDKNYVKYLNRDIDLDKIILKCIKMKEQIVIKDEMDFGLRQTLNLGHTFAHGIESSTSFNKFFHGEAVALGLLLAANLSFFLRLITVDYYKFIKKIIYKYYSNLFEYKFNGEEILKSMAMDKKNKDNYITFVLPTDKEQVKVFNNIPMEIIRKTIAEVNYGFSCK